MVNIDPREWLERKNGRPGQVVDLHGHKRDPELNRLDEMLINKIAQIRIPLTHSRDLRRFAEHLRVLANKFEKISHDNEDAERHLLTDAYNAAR